MNPETIEVKKDDLQALYEVLTNYPAISKEQVVNEMHKCFGEDIFKPKDVTERIKTFEDACNELGKEHTLVREYWDVHHTGIMFGADIIAYLKLRIIAAALNEDWKPQFATDESRYFPWFRLYTQSEIDEMNEEEKSRVVCRSSNYADAGGGVAYAGTFGDSSSTSTSFGARLAFKTRELVEYAGIQFVEIWADYVLKPEEKQVK